MDPGNIAAIIISLVTAFGVVASQRAASKASRDNARLAAEAAKDTSKSDAEKDSYERARNMDVATIERQDREIAELQTENALLREQNNKLNEVQNQNYHLNADVKRISKDNAFLLSDNERLTEEVSELRNRVTRLQRGISPEATETVRVRETDTNPTLPKVIYGREQ